MKSLLIAVVTLFVLFSTSLTQEKEVKQASIKVDGVCNMCKNRIEKAINIDEVKFAKWDRETKKLKLAYESSITLDSLQYLLAMAGHDNEKFTAPDSIYADLHKCCKYRENPQSH